MNYQIYSRTGFISLFIFVLMMGLSPTLWAQHASAIFVYGKAWVERPDGGQHVLTQGMSISQGDSILTAKNSMAQLRFVDGALISIQSNSRFHISEYHYASDGNSGEDKSFFQLLKGGMRSITGAIGKRNKKAYKLSTPVATIGIRGTDYTARLCDGDCTSDDGLYLGVWQGGVSLTNEAGSLNVDAGGYAYVEDARSEPNAISSPDAQLLISEADSGATINDNTQVVASETGLALALAIVDETGAETNLLNGVLETVTTDTTTTGGTDVAGGSTDGTTDTTASDTTTSDTTTDTTTTTDVLALPIIGTASYDLVSGTASDGINSGTVGTATLDADFANMSATASVTVDINNQSWSANSTDIAISSADATMAGNLDVTVIDNDTFDTGMDHTGTISGNFTGLATNGASAPTGVDLAYDMAATVNGELANILGDLQLQLK